MSGLAGERVKTFCPDAPLFGNEGVTALRRQGRTAFSVWDHVLLRQMLLSSPRRVLREFKACQIGALEELKAFRDLRAQNPPAAERIEREARKMGIPIRLSDLLDDVLAGPRGEV